MEHGVTGSFKDKPLAEWLMRNNPTDSAYKKVCVHVSTVSPVSSPSSHLLPWDHKQVTCACAMYMWGFSLRCSSAVCRGCIPETTISRLTLGYIHVHVKPV